MRLSSDAGAVTLAQRIRLRRLKDNLINFSFALPAVLIFSVFYIYPFLKVFQLSMCRWDGIVPFSFVKQFVGLSNFGEVMKNEIWWQSVGHAAWITGIALVFQNAIALALAMACDRELRARNFFRVLFFIPPILSEVVVGFIWHWIYDGDFGLLNHWLRVVGLQNLIHDWLNNPDTALNCIAIVHCWKGFGWGFIILLAGLQTIPRQLYEAARVDGASPWQIFRHVTVPMMVPVFVLVTILTVLGSMQVFILIMSIMGEGLAYHTEVPVTRILGSMLGSSRFGYACAMGIVFGAILITLSFAQKKFSEKLKQA